MLQLKKSQQANKPLQPHRGIIGIQGYISIGKHIDIISSMYYRKKNHHLNKLPKLYNRITHLEVDEPGGKLGRYGIIEM